MGVSELTLEINGKFQRADDFVAPGVIITPPLDEDYWLFRVKVSDKQAIVGFLKFSTIGIGFQQEEDWNTNLPYRVPADEILRHIVHNKGDPEISDAICLEAITLIQGMVAQIMQQ